MRSHRDIPGHVTENQGFALGAWSAIPGMGSAELERELRYQLDETRGAIAELAGQESGPEVIHVSIRGKDAEMRLMR